MGPGSLDGGQGGALHPRRGLDAGDGTSQSRDGTSQSRDATVHRDAAIEQATLVACSGEVEPVLRIPFEV